MPVRGLFALRHIVLGFLICLSLAYAAGCEDGSPGEQKGACSPAADYDITVTGEGVAEEKRMPLKEMLQLPEARYEHVYSVINTWPSKKFVAARGVKLVSILKAAGFDERAQAIVVRSEDGFECKFTCKQLLGTKRYYFPGLMTDDPTGAEQAEVIIAYEYLENCQNLDEVRPDSLCLIVPQAFIGDQTNQSFVKGVTQIEVQLGDPGRWEKATAFPAQGTIARGERVKLQHKNLGQVKLYYSLDGSEPTEKSLLYNPSSYRPELSRPIEINEDTVIKVLVKGFGKNDSEIAEFHYQVI